MKLVRQVGMLSRVRAAGIRFPAPGIRYNRRPIVLLEAPGIRYNTLSHSRARTRANTPMPAISNNSSYTLWKAIRGSRTMRAQSHIPRCIAGMDMGVIAHITRTSIFFNEMISQRVGTRLHAQHIRACDARAIPSNTLRV